MLRPGRFDRQVVVPLPDIIGREAVLKIHSKKISTAPDVDLRTIARRTPGASGADLANMCNEAALMAARANKKIVTMFDFRSAIEKVMFGTERRSMVITEDSRKETAYHEGGHAIVAYNLDILDPIYKATIIPTGMAMGYVALLPEKDEYTKSKEKLKASITMAMGGRVAEELIFGIDKISTGAGGSGGSDIGQATRTARDMVTKYGMSEELGPLAYGENEEEVFLGRSVQKHQNVSEETAKKIDTEVRKIVDECYIKAKEILSEKIDDLHLLAKALIEYETLTGEEIKELIEKRTFVKVDPEQTIKDAGASVPKSGKTSKPNLSPGLKPKPQTS